MALAPFFDRARQSASQVMRHFDAQAFERRLSEVVVTIAFDATGEESIEGQCALDMAARLVARLYPRVAIVPLSGTGELSGQLADLMRSINPEIEIFAEGDARHGVALVVGTTAFNADTLIYIGSDRWVASVSTTAPRGSGNSNNPLGAGAAACIGTANVFRAVFADCVDRPELDQDARLSLLNFETGSRCANADMPRAVDMGLVQLVGAGAIGNAFVWAMARAPNLTGTLHVIDHEPIEMTNLQRYVLACIKHDKASKVELVASTLAQTGIVVHPFRCTWAGYVQGIGHHRFERVAVALDTARDRIQVQSSLPHRIYNAWTQTGDLGVSRHAFDGNHACLACLYLPAGKRRSEDEIIAEELRLIGKANIERTRAMLYHGEPVGEAFVREIAATAEADVDSLLAFASLPLRAFRQRAICGNAILKAHDGNGSDIQVPMAFQSALAGVMLAAEVVASSPGVRATKPGTRTVVDLMRRVPSYVTSEVLKGIPGQARCICEDAVWQDIYHGKFTMA
ncbi:E2 ligase fold family C protein [Novosphingobium sp. FSW06-99]|uniref:E2 ligase fold family C protein n=1 Tax=Novosphingobium sp. FSW06-99 TaxID=1739113 RepID=UPI00076D9E76|nr:E2 ligase fold family C protein [Novosphingobium sp. FSW06-99]KUR78071.1 hypothetical protein AQZ49_08580 [Novosphingobium sp. FSW06-99]